MKPVWIVSVVAMVFAGCSVASAQRGDGPEDDVVLRIVVGGEVARDWTLTEIEADVPFVEIVIEGDTQTDPTLLPTIAASGVRDWDMAEVLGMSEGRVVEVALDIRAADVDDSWILNVSNRGTLKLAAEGLERQRWVRDVGEIRFP